MIKLFRTKEQKLCDEIGADEVVHKNKIIVPKSFQKNQSTER
jgi:hypothetical protein